MPADAEAEVARKLASLSTREIVDALGVGQSSRWLARVVSLLVRGPSARLGRQLARFDARIQRVGVVEAAREALTVFGARLDLDGAPPKGPVLVIANHPGAFDTLALFSALDRRDACVLAADRPFLCAMPNLSDRLVQIPESAFGRVSALRRATALLRKGSLLIHFGAGAIEADLRFPSGPALSPWPAGAGALALAAAHQNAAVVPAFVAGVHSARAKKLTIVRLVERRGVTTVAPLIQATLPGFRDVIVSVSIGAPVSSRALVDAKNDTERTSIVRDAVASLGQAMIERWNDATESAHFGSKREHRSAAAFSRPSAD